MNKSNHTLFSIIIPTYNRPDSLDRALRSIATQLASDMEVIVVNDASTKDYHEHIKLHQCLISHYRVLEKNGGVSTARNEGLRLAKGDWICFLDDDDTYATDYFQNLRSEIEDQKLNENSFFWFTVEERSYSSSKSNYTRKMIYPRFRKSAKTYYLGPSALSIGASYAFGLHKNLIERVGAFDPEFRLGEDTDLLIRLMKSGADPTYICKVGVIKHIREESRQLTTDNYSNYSNLKIYERLIEKHKDFLNKEFPFIIFFIFWAASCHYKNNRYLDGHIMSKKIFELKMSKAKRYIAYCICKLALKYAAMTRRTNKEKG